MNWTCPVDILWKRYWQLICFFCWKLSVARTCREINREHFKEIWNHNICNQTLSDISLIPSLLTVENFDFSSLKPGNLIAKRLCWSRRGCKTRIKGVFVLTLRCDPRAPVLIMSYWCWYSLNVLNKTTIFEYL